jgi:hypothetical protein
MYERIGAPTAWKCAGASYINCEQLDIGKAANSLIPHRRNYYISC